MTQSFNLSQLANNLTSAGLLDAADGLVNAVPIANGGTGATTASAARSNLGVPALVYAMPSGGIIMWSGSIISIPTGWLLCDGSSGTPDLRDRFITGAGSTYAVGSTGGRTDAVLVAHAHAFSGTTGGQSADHYHGPRDGAGNFIMGNTGPNGGFAGGASYTNTNGTDQTGVNASDHSHVYSGVTGSEGESGTNQNLPPFYALAFIMKS